MTPYKKVLRRAPVYGGKCASKN